MRDSFGGIASIALIVFFIVIAFSYLAFNVNYTKASRMKDKIISIYNQYNGDCSSAICKEKIANYAKAIDYKPSTVLMCNRSNDEDNGTKADNEANIYCIKKVVTSSPKQDPDNGQFEAGSTSYYYEIRTIINTDVPIIKNILGYENFQIKGQTKTFTE